jgi:dTDP-4-dehydrorhamnose reductase
LKKRSSVLRIYVFGAEGQVARSLREAAAKWPEFIVGYGARPDVDILRPEQVERALADFVPDIVVNPAAYTAVDRAESEPELAFETNRDGAGNVAQAAQRLNIPVIHLSTDYVFDGRKKSAYLETDPVGPRCVYGRSKLAGERKVASANSRHIILRTAWVYAPFGSNFVRTVLRLTAERDRLRVVDDQIGCPTYAPDIAEAILAIASKIGTSGWRDSFAGITHLAGPDEITWCNFARQIIGIAKTKGCRDVGVDAIMSVEYPTPAERPANSRMCCDRLADVFDVRLPPLQSSLEHCLGRLLNGHLAEDKT